VDEVWDVSVGGVS